MLHNVHDKKFNREANERKALFVGLLRNLTLHGEIVTTQARAKVIKGMADKLVSQAKDNSLASRRLLHRTFGKRDVVNTLVERVAPAMADRNSGFTRVIALGNRRGDNTPMAKIAFVNKPETTGTLKSGKTHEVKKTVETPKVKTTKAEVAKKTKVAKKSTKATE